MKKIFTTTILLLISLNAFSSVNRSDLLLEVEDEAEIIENIDADFLSGKDIKEEKFLLEEIRKAINEKQKFLKASKEINLKEGLTLNAFAKKLMKVNKRSIAKAFAKAVELSETQGDKSLLEHFNSVVRNSQDLEFLDVSQYEQSSRRRLYYFVSAVPCDIYKKDSLHTLIAGKTDWWCSGRTIFPSGMMKTELSTEYVLGPGAYVENRFSRNKNIRICISGGRFSGLGVSAAVGLKYGVRVATWIGNGVCLQVGGTDNAYGAYSGLSLTVF
jgi:hypothetical protein